MNEEIKQIICDINKIIVESDKLEFTGELVRAYCCFITNEYSYLGQ